LPCAIPSRETEHLQTLGVPAWQFLKDLAAKYAQGILMSKTFRGLPHIKMAENRILNKTADQIIDEETDCPICGTSLVNDRCPQPTKDNP